jgi:hypothetical protein
MLDLNPDIVCAVIAAAREFQAKEAVVIPEREFAPSDDWALQVLADHADDLTFAEVKGSIDDLEPDQQVELVALMWLGRGDFDTSEWEEAVSEARDSYTERTAEYLLATPLVADYLEEGLYQLGHRCQE